MFSLFKRVTRSAEAQQRLEEACAGLTLYHFPTCPFCWRVRLAIKRLGLPIRLVNVMREPDARIDLMTRGGKLQVPCLHINTAQGSHWLYESGDIVDWLQQNFAGGVR
jgi:glutathione S-transferase